MDDNASNFNGDATIQGYDQWGNLMCICFMWWYSEYGCIYTDGFEYSELLVLKNAYHTVDSVYGK